MSKGDHLQMKTITKKVVEGIKGFKLDSYLMALEGWRRGLTLKWYKDESPNCHLHRLNGSTQGNFFSLSSESKTHYFFRSRGDLVSNETVKIVQNKEKTKKIIGDKVPVPIGKMFKKSDKTGIINYANEIGFPIVVKPINGSMGRSVYSNIKSNEELQMVLSEIEKYKRYNDYLIEKYYPGKEYRIYVVGDNVIGATRRIPANVVGDGIDNIEQLIKKKNLERKKNPYLAIKPIKIDFEVKNMLSKLNYDLKSIPKAGERVFLRGKSNLSAGGDPIEATDELSDEVKSIAVATLKALPSIPHGAVDIIVNPDDNKKGVVLEVNATAEIAFHLFPLEGNSKNVPAAIIDYYFPETKNVSKSLFYFDYKSILEPLKTWATDEVKVASPYFRKIYKKKYLVTGKVQKVGYMTWIRRQALRKQLHGFSEKRGDNQILVTIYGPDKYELEKFRELCKKGSKKSKVEKVDETEIEIVQNEPIKLGFEIIL